MLRHRSMMICLPALALWTAGTGLSASPGGHPGGGHSSGGHAGASAVAHGYSGGRYSGGGHYPGGGHSYGVPGGYHGGGYYRGYPSYGHGYASYYRGYSGYGRGYSGYYRGYPGYGRGYAGYYRNYPVYYRRSYYPLIGFGLGFGLGYPYLYGRSYYDYPYYDYPYYGSAYGRYDASVTPYLSDESAYLRTYPPPLTSLAPADELPPPSAAVPPASALPQGEDDAGTRITVRVPPDAEVWVDGQKMRQTGNARQFIVPPLEPDRDYHYAIRARWAEDGRVVERTREVTVRAGDRLAVSFLSPSPRTAPVP